MKSRACCNSILAGLNVGVESTRPKTKKEKEERRRETSGGSSGGDEAVQLRLLEQVKSCYRSLSLCASPLHSSTPFSVKSPSQALPSSPASPCCSAIAKMDSSTLPAQGVTTDICHFTIHFPTSQSTPEQLTAAASSILALFHSLSTHSSSSGQPLPYLWHSAQPPALTPSPLDFSLPTSQAQTQHLVGKLEVTDCVDDEWFLVWLLKEVTKEFGDAVVSVNDADGEFLLIEGAEVLPLWVTPTNATNRVRFLFFIIALQLTLLHFTGLDPSISAPFDSPLALLASPLRFQLGRLALLRPRARCLH